MKTFHIHLVSDSTAETVCTVARASLVQFDKVETVDHLWSMVRNAEQLDNVLAMIAKDPGFVLYTLVNNTMRDQLEEGCRELGVPCISVLEPVIDALGQYMEAESRSRPGRQHVLDDNYFCRIEAMQFALTHDDGQSAHGIDEADVVLLGVSRTSKTPTSIYLANRGIKVANIPIVPNCPIPQEVFKASRPLIVGLTKEPKRLVEIRRQRLRMLDQDENTDYVDPEMVSREINKARRLFAKHNWPVINVSRKSIEETAATILQLFASHQEIGS